MSKILVVDDEMTIRVLLRAVLEESGHTMLEASDGPSALEVARQARPDLVLLDIALPQLSGLEVCRQLQEDPATSAVPILLLTGLVQQSEREAAAKAGAQGFIAKPFSPVALLVEVKDALLRHTGVLSR